MAYCFNMRKVLAYHARDTHVSCPRYARITAVIRELLLYACVVITALCADNQRIIGMLRTIFKMPISDKG